MAKLRKRFSLLAAAKELSGFDEDGALEVSTTSVPDDVKEGHFAVLVVKGSEKNRFVVELEYLNCPEFLSLPEQAEEEFGFEQTGALVVPCRPHELQKILGRHDGDKRLYLGE